MGRFLWKHLNIAIGRFFVIASGNWSLIFCKFIYFKTEHHFMTMKTSGRFKTKKNLQILRPTSSTWCALMHYVSVTWMSQVASCRLKTDPGWKLRLFDFKEKKETNKIWNEMDPLTKIHEIGIMHKWKTMHRAILIHNWTREFCTLGAMPSKPLR